jgi:hypothetical protein
MTHFLYNLQFAQGDSEISLEKEPGIVDEEKKP